METTNAIVARVLADLTQLIQWAEGDAEHSEEMGAVVQTMDDHERVNRLKQARQIVQGCHR